MLTAPLAPTLIVMPWRDPVVEAVGFDARSAYVELFWLGILGPANIACLPTRMRVVSHRAVSQRSRKRLDREAVECRNGGEV